MPTRPPSLRSLVAFEAAARHQSFAKAAGELNLTQSAVSHAIRALERRLDQPLFERGGRTATLTAAGRRLAARVRLGLSLLGDAFETGAGGTPQRLVVSTLASVAQRLLLPGLSRLTALLPHTLLDLRCTDALADLAGGDVDVALRFGPGQWAGLQSRRLADERLFPVASPSYRGGDLPRTVDELRGCGLIRHPESAWRIWLDPLGIDDAAFPSALLVDDAALALEAAAAGNGVALARSRLAAPDLRSGRLVRLFDHEVPAEYAYWCVWSATSPKQKAIAAFVDWAAAEFAGGSAAG